MAAPVKQLTERNKRFVNEFLANKGDATSAAISAGYSAKTAASIGCQLLKHPKVAAELARRRAPLEKKAQLTAEKIYEALSNLLDFDPAELVDDNGKWLKLKDMPLEARKAIAGIDGDKLRFVSRLGVIELSAKLLGMVKQEQTQQQAVQIIIAAPPEVTASPTPSGKLLPRWE